MKKRISFCVMIRGADGPTAVRVSVDPRPLLKAAAGIAALAAGIGVFLKKRM